MQSISGSLPSSNIRLIGSKPKAKRARGSAPETRAQVVANFGAASETPPFARVTGGSIGAFVALIRPFERAIYLAALAFVYKQEEAVQVAQETIVRAFGSMVNLTRPEQFRSWLIGLAVNEARTFLRERKHMDCDDFSVEDETDHLEFAPGSLSNWGPIPADGMRQPQMRDTLNEALLRLPRKLRVVLFLRDVLNLTTAETAKLIGVSEETIRTRLARARFAVCGDLGQRNNSIRTKTVIPAKVIFSN